MWLISLIDQNSWFLFIKLHSMYWKYII